jgi:hypothetical protein
VALTDQVKDRLYNWKFASACGLLHEQILAGDVTPTADEQDTIEALSRMFTNCGWFDGDFGVVVGVAVRSLIGEDASGSS